MSKHAQPDYERTEPRRRTPPPLDGPGPELDDPAQDVTAAERQADTDLSDIDDQPAGEARPPYSDECLIGSCPKPVDTRGLCIGHWQTRRGEALPKDAR